MSLGGDECRRIYRRMKQRPERSTMPELFPNDKKHGFEEPNVAQGSIYLQSHALSLNADTRHDKRPNPPPTATQSTYTQYRM